MTLKTYFFQRMIQLRWLLLLCAIAFSGCTDNIWRGEIASVNGKFITLAQVTALRNSTHFDWISSPLAEVDVMRKQYGDALTNLIVVELVKQHLAKKKIPVTDAEVAMEEDVIRADYPPGAFEEILISEAIDIEIWRFLLRNYLSVQRFLDKALRPEIIISPDEAAAYLQANRKDFIRPPWVYFLLISGADSEAVALCGNDLIKDDDPLEVQKENPDVVIRTVRMDMQRLPPFLSEQLEKMQPGDLSSVISAEDGHHQMLLLQTLPEREPTPDEAYLQIERILVSGKLHEAYNAWVLNSLEKATIKVTQQLLPHLRKSGAISQTREEKDTAPAS